ncbi:hypothetical protein PHMEG_00016027 [Phytophthora megakarya]|uniref:Uncharacterized protein n=1 Tax=Phytophthora megakarya TaxID=4795 RepID=A0A225W0A3_9STRA|nr:hypothetical protein PHMEG_00016027 [Phytophthora megakarya]
MADAEDSHLKRFQQIAYFSSATYLMGVSHRSQTDRHLQPSHHRLVVDGIVRLHYTESNITYYTKKNEVVTQCRGVPKFALFVKYFAKQWFDCQFWRWQACRTPSRYATINNPSETYNAIIKKYTGKRRCHTQPYLA